MSAVARLRQAPEPAADTPRSQLAAAIAAHADARQVVARAADALARARQMLDEAQAIAAPFQDLDARIVDHRAGLIRTWAAGGGARPDTSTLPATLEAERQVKADADAQAAAAQAAVDGLASELAAAEARGQAAQATLADAACGVMIAEASAWAAELAEVKARAYLLQVELEAMAESWLPGTRPGPLRITPAVIAALNWQPPGHIISVSPIAEARARHMAYHAALTSDAGAASPVA